MRIDPLDVGLEVISRLRVGDEVHLPTARPMAPTFLPVESQLDQILKRPNLDQRLVSLTQPPVLDPELLEASVLGQVRREVQALIKKEASGKPRRQRRALEEAEEALSEDIELDEAVSAALAALLQG